MALLPVVLVFVDRAWDLSHKVRSSIARAPDAIRTVGRVAANREGPYHPHLLDVCRAGDRASAGPPVRMVARSRRARGDREPSHGRDLWVLPRGASRQLVC